MHRPLRWYNFIAINAYWLGINIATGIITPLLLPYLVVQFMPAEYKNTYLANLRVVGLAVAMLAQPLFGMLSDRSRSRFGRRKPFIVASALLNVLFLVVIALSPNFVGSDLDSFFENNYGVTAAYAVLMVGLVLLQFSSNIGHGALQGLLPDVVPQEQRGQASGVKAVFELLPSLLILGFAVGKMVDQGNVWLVVGIIMAGFLLTMLVNVLFVQENPAGVASQTIPAVRVQVDGGTAAGGPVAAGQAAAREQGAQAVNQSTPAEAALPRRSAVEIDRKAVGHRQAAGPNGFHKNDFQQADQALPAPAQPASAPAERMWPAFLRLLALTVLFVGATRIALWLVQRGAEFVGGQAVSMEAKIGLVGLAGLLAMAGSILVGVYFGAWVGIGKEAPQRQGFIWWVINRLLFLAAVGSIQGFAQYFLADVLHIPDAAAMTTRLLAAVALFLIPSALFGGWLADRIGQRRLVGLAGIVAMLGTLLLIFSPSVPMVMVSGAVIGLATGTFMATNWALGTQLVPPQDAGRYLGISNLAGAGAGIVGAGIGGPIADFFNGLQPGLGYLVLFSIYAGLFGLSVVVLGKVKV